MSLLTIKNLKRVIKKPSLLYEFPKLSINNYLTKKTYFSQISQEEHRAYSEEVKGSGLVDFIQDKKRSFEKNVKGSTVRGNTYTFGAIDDNSALRVYSLIRKYKPQTLVETGVCNGVSTAFILLAMHNNKQGQLYSIDYPEVEGMQYKDGTFWSNKGGASIPKNKQPGWVIPDHLRQNWNLILGKTQDKLPPLLEKLQTIDFFMHDSEHSYECMIFEYEEAYKYLKEGGTLFSDDIIWNSAFYDFSKKVQRKPI